MFEEWWMPFLSWGVLALATGAISGWCWRRWPPAERSLWPCQPWPQNFPGGGEVLLFFLFMVFVPPLVNGLLQAAGFFQLVYGDEPSLIRQSLWVTMPALPLILLGTWPIMNLRRQTAWSDIGGSTQHWRQNIHLGYLVWLVSTPPVLAINLVLNLFLEGEEHAFVHLSRETLLPVEWFLLVFQAVVFAPLVEELAFRGVLQSWLYRASLTGHWLLAVAAVLIPVGPTLDWLISYLSAAWFQVPLNDNDQPLLTAPPSGPWIFALVVAGIYLFTAWRCRPGLGVRSQESGVRCQESGGSHPEGPLWLGASRPQDQLVVVDSEEILYKTASVPQPSPWPAILGSALLWAVIHSSWPSPIPLFFLGLVLGWLAYRTQNLIGPVVVHCLFNGVACIVLGLMRWWG